MIAAAEPDDRRALRNVAVLVFAQAVLGSQLAVHIILGGLAGAALADDRSLATLPISVVVLVSMFMAPGASLLMGRYGRRAGFLLGAAAGAIGGALAARALFVESFWLLVLGAAFTGVYQSFQGFYRFAAADTASEKLKPRAISWVFAGGLLSALIGPEIVRSTSEAFAPVPFAGAYIAIVVVNIVGAAGLLLLDIPVPSRADAASRASRPLGVIARQPVFVVAVLCAMVGFASMNLVMTSTPLALAAHGFTTSHAADVVRWHILAMFAPSFVTGSIIARVGHLPVISAGLLLLGACGVVALAGVDLHHFYIALIALGFGWNFAFVGATSLLGTVHTRAEQAKVQGLNDFLVFGLVAAASFASGALLEHYGWHAVQLAMLPALVICGLAIAWLAAAGRRHPGGAPLVAGAPPAPEPPR
jgi:MFS family permease